MWSLSHSDPNKLQWMWRAIKSNRRAKQRGTRDGHCQPWKGKHKVWVGHGENGREGTGPGAALPSFWDATILLLVTTFSRAILSCYTASPGRIWLIHERSILEMEQKRNHPLEGGEIIIISPAIRQAHNLELRCRQLGCRLLILDVQMPSSYCQRKRDPNCPCKWKHWWRKALRRHFIIRGLATGVPAKFHPLNDCLATANETVILTVCRHFQLPDEEKATLFSVAEGSF